MSTQQPKRDLVFDKRFLEDLTYWVKTDRDANVWSRRLTEADRIVYLVTADRIELLQGRYHYDD